MSGHDPDYPVTAHPSSATFDLDCRHAGITEDAASLVDSMSDDEASVTLINLSSVHGHALVLQASAYADHQFTPCRLTATPLP